MDILHASVLESDARQPVDVGQPFAWRMRREGGGGFGMRRHEDLAHVIAHLERVRPDGGPHPGQDVSRCRPHRSDCGFQHAASQAAPAGMGGSHDAAGTVAEQHRQAVRSQHRADLPGFACERRVGFGIRLVPELDHPGAVHLPEPARLSGQLLAKVRTVGGDVIRIVADMVDISSRRYFLYDLFEHDPSMPHHRMAEHGEGLYAHVRERFPEENVIITKGRVPDSLAIAAPDKVAMMHLDLNNMEAEIGALEVLWDRIVPGGILILDDFGWMAYQRQHRAEVAWLGERGHPILEMPTGQGLVIKQG